MVFNNFDEMIQAVKQQERVKKVVVASAADEHTLQAVFRAKEDGLVEPILIGEKEQVKQVLTKLGEFLPEEMLVDAAEPKEAAIKAVAMINAGKADFIMKGKLQTSDLLKAVVDKEKGLRTGNVMSHMAIHELESYHKLLAVTDGGMMTYPDLDKKRQIIENAVSTFRGMGYENPKVAVLAAVEKVNPKMPETVEADQLKQMNEDGIITGCIVEGPISYDLAWSKESAAIKGFESPVVGDADIMLVPNIQTGNILGKCLTYSAGAKMAGFIIGAKCPIVLTSRGASAEEKYLSLALCAAIGD
jgi:phosphate butyryltransferase